MRHVFLILVKDCLLSQHEIGVACDSCCFLGCLEFPEPLIVSVTFDQVIQCCFGLMKKFMLYLPDIREFNYASYEHNLRTPKLTAAEGRFI